MNANELTTIHQVRAFLAETQQVAFEVAGDKQSRYDWILRTLVKFDYLGCGKADRGVLIRIELTKSRARHSNDNALVECKNGHVVRKLLGHAHILRRWAGPLNEFHWQHLNPYVNYHRPCLFPETVTDTKGKQRKRYPYMNLMTPYEKLKSLDNAATYLKTDVSFEILDQVAYGISDNAAADALQQPRRDIFTTIHEQEYKRA